MDDSDTEEDNNDIVRRLLDIARSEIGSSTADPTQALSCLLHAIRLTKGEDAIPHFLDAAKNLARENPHPYISESELFEDALQMSKALISDQTTLLYEQGRETILKDAFEDGSSVVCNACQALVRKDRFRQHQVFWCDVTGQKDDEREEAQDEDMEEEL